MMNPRKPSENLHIIPVQANQQTTFWKILQEGDENAVFLGKEGLGSVPKNLERFGPSGTHI